MAERPRDSEHVAWLAELQRVLRERDVRPVFQPVVDLNDGHTVALEAYARGPAGSVFRLPRVMFSVGQQAGFGVDLDRLCHRLAIEAITAENAPALLFLNTTVEYLVDSEWCSEGTLAALARAGLAPDRIVLEVTESQLTADPSSYRDALQPIRSLGYKLSLDDVGSSARSAELVDRLRPEFLKFDLTLVRGLAGDQLRRELVRSLVRLAARAGARLVAERVETEAERVALLECGASWGQGYFFAGETAQAGADGSPGADA
jgi:EAL domain-containing protein (putative c-di-GMP-specific phosphodiesterase class I)